MRQILGEGLRRKLRAEHLAKKTISRLLNGLGLRVWGFGFRDLGSRV